MCASALNGSSRRSSSRWRRSAPSTARLLGHVDDIRAAVKRKELGDLLARLDAAAIDAEVIRRASDPFAVHVRALDAIHVATAEILATETAGEPLEFWTHDDRQATAALSRGLTVLGI